MHLCTVISEAMTEFVGSYADQGTGQQHTECCQRELLSRYRSSVLVNCCNYEAKHVGSGYMFCLDLVFSCCHLRTHAFLW